MDANALGHGIVYDIRFRTADDFQEGDTIIPSVRPEYYDYLLRLADNPEECRTDERQTLVKRKVGELSFEAA
jgi:hypothetical protein